MPVELTTHLYFPVSYRILLCFSTPYLTRKMFHCEITWSSSMRGEGDLPHDAESYQFHLDHLPLPHGEIVKAKELNRICMALNKQP